MSVEPLTPPEVSPSPPAPAETAPGTGPVGRAARAVQAPFTRRALNAAERQVEEEILRHFPQAEIAGVREAYNFAVEAHGEQKPRQRRAVRQSHPLAVARILAELGLDPDAVQAALLHDIPEDTDYSLDDVEERFGPEVAKLVDGVTKLSKFGARTIEEQQAENIRKMLLAMAEDIRVVLIKLADRLHNMRTLAALPPEKQQRIARQTAEIYAPLAERLGIWQIKWELEDLSFKVLEPDELPRARRRSSRRHRKEREAFVKRAMAVLQRRARARPASRPRSPAGPSTSIRSGKRCSARARSFDEIYDVHAVRVLVDDVADCYAALGVVHSTLAADPGPVRRLHRHAQGQRLPVAAHRRDRARRQAARSPDPHARDAPRQRDAASPRTGATRKAARPTATTTPSSPGCAS